MTAIAKPGEATRANARRRGSGRPARNVLAAISGAHWAMEPEALRTMMAIAARLNPSIDAIEADRGKVLDNTYSVTIRDGVATIPVHGRMFRYGDYFSYASGATTYEQLAEDFLAVRADSDVRAVLFDIDSVGGEVNGCQGFAALIHDQLGDIPMAAYANGDCCSAALWIASAAGRIYAAPTAIVGSLGCCAIFTDFSKWDESQGIEEVEIISSQTPRKREDPTTPAGRASMQAVVDALADVFLGEVADYLGVPLATVLSDFGQGGVFVGAAAVDAGIAEGVASFDDVHDELRARVAGDARTTMILGTGRSLGDSTMKTAPARADATTGSGDTPPKTDPAAPEKKEEQDKEKQKEKEEQPAAGSPSASREDIAAAERTRVTGIQSLRRSASEDTLIAACVADPKCTVADAALKLRNAEPARGAAYLDGLKADEKNNPAPAATAAADASKETSVEALSDKIANAGKPAVQRAQR